MNLIEQVLEAQAEFYRRRAAYLLHPSQHAQEDEYEAEAILNELATTAAPKLARALQKAFDLLRSYRDRRTEFERITGESDHTVDRCEHAMNICRQQRVDKIIAEIEKELA